MNNFKVYKYTNQLTKKVYIGQTKQTLKKRAGGKYGQNYTRENTYFSRAIKKYNWDNFKPEILFDNLSKNEASIKEAEMILKYDSYNPEKGYNGTLGDSTCSPTQETKNKISKGVKNSKIFYKNNFESHAKKVVGISIKDKTFEIFDSITIAQEKTSVHRTNIIGVCKGKNNSAKGYLWRYVENFNQNDIEIYIENYKILESKRYDAERNAKISASQKRRLSKKGATDYLKQKVKRIDPSTKEEIVYDSLTEAAKNNNIKAPSNISLVCKGKREKAGGYYWQFIE